MGVGAGLYMYDVVVKTFTFAISSTDEFLYKRSPELSNSLTGLREIWHDNSGSAMLTAVVVHCRTLNETVYVYVIKTSPHVNCVNCYTALQSSTIQS